MLAASGVRTHAPGVIRSPDHGGQVPASVRGDNLQSGMTVENAREDEMRERDGILGGLADRVREVEAVEPLVEAAAERVQKDDGLEFHGAGPERLESFVGELDVCGERRDLNARQTVVEDRVVEGTHEELGVLQRHQPQTGQSMRRLRDVFGDQTVRLLRRPLGQVLRCPGVEVVRRCADPLVLNAPSIHIGEPHAHVGELRDARAHHGSGYRLARNAVASQVERRGLGYHTGRAALDFCVERRHQEVRVDVDRAAAGHAPLGRNPVDSGHVASAPGSGV